MKTHRTTPLAVEQIEPHMCSVALRLKMLAQVPFFARLSTNEIAAVNRSFREHGYVPGETIYRAGDSALRLYVVASGKVKVTRPTIAGQDVAMEILAPGEFFGSLSALGDVEYADTALAQTACCVLGIGTDDFQAILRQYPAVTISVLNIVGERLHGAQDTIRQLSANTVESRVASTLLKLAEKLGEETKGGTLIQTPLSRQDLAEMTGTTTETVSRVLSHLRKAGVIRSGRRWIAITNRAKLVALASDGAE
ncbi:MAG: Crp/Fnr family transcriptional regulator [Chloroflexi bacterium]|nr:Crp/Fnr family transcriptional regulator [Chloroflexota bacterium]